MAVPEAGAISQGIVWAASKQPAADPSLATANAALDAAGWTPGLDGVRVHGATRLHLRLAVADVIPLPDLAAGITLQLTRVGIAAEVVTMLPTALAPAPRSAGRGYDMALADWDSGPDPDVSSFWRSTAVPPSGFNVSGGQVDPFLDQALDRLATLTDTPSRMTAAAAVSSQLADDLPAVFLETPELSLVVRPGITVKVPPVGSSGARFNDIASWRRG